MSSASAVKSSPEAITLTRKDFLAPTLVGPIEGVEWKRLVSHADSRGFFREVIRTTDPLFSTTPAGGNPFGQWSHSKMAQHTVKAWHFHHVQSDWWYVGVGELEVVLFDNRPKSPTYEQMVICRLGDESEDPTGEEVVSAVVKIPPGVLHGCEVLSPYAHLFYITSHVYNPQDEGRLPYNTPRVPHKWRGEELIVAEKDKVEFVPVAELP